ncbi:MAG: sn-glycerol-3-phosphate ABC transporter ATP-binding protein UgpC [Thermoanaerobaculum sp.]|nr:sn-glycerol-3-phosphate ABC transporter ATP-binding protein UgpC [Thermoanaerobaculum sp.]
MAGVVLEQVRKCFGQREVLRPLDLRVEAGEFLVLLGPSGCGKTTVLRLVAGLEQVTSGRIFIHGRDVTHLEPKERDVAMVFQNYALYPHMTVAENLAFALRVQKRPKDEVWRRVHEVAAQLDIHHLLQAYPRQLSGGQRQRVALGRAMVRNPQVFLFDEPLSNIDAKLRVQTRAEIAQLQRSLGTTTLYVTHDQVEALTLGHRVAVMKDGQLQQVGTPLEVYRYPANAFVATFVGSPPMNLFPGQLVDGGSSVELAGGVKVALPRPVQGNGEVWLGLRPEHLRLASEGRGSLLLAVEVVEPLGAQTNVAGMAAESWCVVSLFQLASARPGDRLWLTFSPEDIRLFARPSGARLFP